MWVRSRRLAKFAWVAQLAERLPRILIHSSIGNWNGRYRQGKPPAKWSCETIRGSTPRRSASDRLPLAWELVLKTRGCNRLAGSNPVLPAKG